MMENSSLSGDVWNDITTSSSEDDGLKMYLAQIRDLALKYIYVIIGTVGIIDNLFVIIIFVMFIKIKNKVLNTFLLILFIGYDRLSVFLRRTKIISCIDHWKSIMCRCKISRRSSTSVMYQKNLRMVDSRLFDRIQSPSHCLSHLLPPQKYHPGLRTRGHSYSLPICSSDLCKRFFIPRCLFCFL